jgi:multisubunit Na+/H+ antiporter MnhB subunit
MIPLTSPRMLLRRASLVILVAALAALLGGAVLELPREPGGLTALVATRLADSGVEHAVTAVLLNFRGYDTWLELGVLVLALAGCLGMLQQRDLTHATPAPSRDAVLTRLVRLLAPVMVLIAGYLLWLGKAAAGGAFQSGVVLAAVWVLLWFAGRRGVVALPAHAWRALVVAGMMGFLAVGAATLARHGTLLQLTRTHAAAVILALEILATLSIGAILASLVIAPQAGRTATPPPP